MFLSLKETNASNIEQEPDVTIRHELLCRDFCVVKSQTAIVAWIKSDFPNILAVTFPKQPRFSYKCFQFRRRWFKSYGTGFKLLQ
jgi:hypothetical protein